MEDIINTGALEGMFSVAVAAYLLVRMERKLEALNSTLIELTIAVRAAHGDRHDTPHD